MEFTAPFGAWLKEQRARLDLTQGDLARRVGYSPITIRKVEAGALKPSKQMLDLIADHLGVPDAQRDAFIDFALGKSTIDEAARNNLPSPATTLIGRDNDVVATIKLAKKPEARLVTLVGPPGVGKTRLAIEVARQAASHFAGGVCWVELAPVTDPNIALSTIAHALEIELGSGKPVLRLLQDHLREKQMLLVLDNLEQVLDVAPLLGQVLGAAPKVKAICTSRELLRIAGEQSYTVQPLGDEAITLFAQRAQSIQPDFEITPDNAATLADICRKLDGLPLAIELAAARIGLFTSKEMLSRLNQRLNLLTSGGRDLPARQRTLRATLEWSYGLLSGDEQALFRRLGVFAGGCTLHAVQTFLEIDNDLKLTAEDGLAALMDKSLLVRREDDKGDSRYFLLETMREFALEKLKQHGEYDLWMERLAHYLYHLKQGEHPHLAFANEVENWRAAMNWLLQNADVKMELAFKHLERANFFISNREEVIWLAKVLDHPKTATLPVARANALFEMGYSQRILGDLKQAQTHLHQSLTLCRDHHLRELTHLVLDELGLVEREQGNVERAREYLQEALALAHEMGNDWSCAEMRNSLAEVEVIAGNTTDARRLLMQSLEIAREQVNENPFLMGWSINHLGHVAMLEGNLAEAKRWVTQSIQLFDSAGPVWGVRDYGKAWDYHCLGEIALAERDIEPASSYFRQAIPLAFQFNDNLCISWCMAGLAGAAALDEEPERGAKLWGASEALREQIGCRIAPASRPNRERTVMLLREQLGEVEFARLTAEGAKLSVDEAVEFALAVKCGG